jgi:hypothetical protein
LLDNPAAAARLIGVEGDPRLVRRRDARARARACARARTARPPAWRSSGGARGVQARLVAAALIRLGDALGTQPQPQPQARPSPLPPAVRSRRER